MNDDTDAKKTTLRYLSKDSAITEQVPIVDRIKSIENSYRQTVASFELGKLCKNDTENIMNRPSLSVSSSPAVGQSAPNISLTTVKVLRSQDDTNEDEVDSSSLSYVSQKKKLFEQVLPIQSNTSRRGWTQSLSGSRGLKRAHTFTHFGRTAVARSCSSTSEAASLSCPSTNDRKGNTSASVAPTTSRHTGCPTSSLSDRSPSVPSIKVGFVLLGYCLHYVSSNSR